MRREKEASSPRSLLKRNSTRGLGESAGKGKEPARARETPPEK